MARTTKRKSARTTHRPKSRRASSTDSNPPEPASPQLAFLNEDFLRNPEARSLRILSEYLEPAQRFEAHDVRDTICVFGSARILPENEANRQLVAARKARQGVGAARQRVRMSRYYEETRELARRLTEWSKGLPGGKRFVICTGGGPGIMEAANRGASEARGINIGLNIALPFEQKPNPYSTRSLTFDFHYFFMRKFWFAYFAKAMVFMPGGFGTLDEMAEILTLCQTLKLKKKMPMVLYGADFWRQALNLNMLVKSGTIARDDLDLLHRSDTVDDAFDFITHELSGEPLQEPGSTLTSNRGVITGAPER